MKANCWTCPNNTDGSCAIVANRNELREQVLDWLVGTTIDANDMPPKDADGCPGYPANIQAPQGGGPAQEHPEAVDAFRAIQSAGLAWVTNAITAHQLVAQIGKALDNLPEDWRKAIEE